MSASVTISMSIIWRERTLRLSGAESVSVTTPDWLESRIGAASGAAWVGAGEGTAVMERRVLREGFADTLDRGAIRVDGSAGGGGSLLLCFSEIHATVLTLVGIYSGGRARCVVDAVPEAARGPDRRTGSGAGGAETRKKPKNYT